MSEPRRRQSLVTRVLIAMVLVLSVGGALAAAATLWNGRQAARQSYDRILLGAANDIAESIRILDGAPIVDLPVSAFDLLAQAPDDRIYYAVTGPGSAMITGLAESVLIAPPGDDDVTARFFDARMQDEDARFVRVVRRFVERDFSGPVEVVVGQTLRARQAMTVALARDALLPIAAAGILILLMAWVVTRSALRPLGDLTQDLARRDPYDLTPVATDRVPGELQVMLGAMNRFMGRLDGQFEAMRNLISDTAHQLRTPVAAIRVQAETALAAPAEEDQKRALDRLLTRTRSLGTLLDQLLSRALVIHRTDGAPRLPVDLREVALEVIEREDHALLAPGAALRLEIGEEPVIVHADAFSLGEAARNLVGNALRHGVPPVTVGAGQNGDMAVIWVRDSGSGPAEAVLARLGDRFNRSSASREDSAGIGLSIVKSVATAFGGSVEMVRDDAGFRVALVLPLAKET